MTRPDPRPERLVDDALVVAISNDHTFLHVSSAAAIVTHMGGEHGSGVGGGRLVAAPPGDERVVDFYDADGALLRPLVSADLVVVGLASIPGVEADPRAVLQRIGDALDLAQARLAANPELGAQQSLPPATQVPRPEGGLADVLAALDQEFDVQAGASHRAGWFHNLFHV